jgi:hypothetical protein
MIRRNGNWYIRRRLTVWDPATRKNIPFASGGAIPEGFLAAGKDTLFVNRFTSCGGQMTYVGDGIWEVKVAGLDLDPALTTAGDPEEIFERVIINSLQYDDYERLKVSDDTFVRS